MTPAAALAGELDRRFSAPDARPTPWSEVEHVLDRAETFWFVSVRPEPRPHATPVIAVWLDGAAYLCTGPQERKARNLETHASCLLMTGTDRLVDGLDVVLEGDAQRVIDRARLRVVADAYRRKYGEDWAFEVGDGTFVHPHGGEALVFEVAPRTAFAFRKGSYSQTRWRLATDGPRATG